ncbi:uncharacterized protein LOC132256775 [Phlebotomus argentipes]|uniref:uncharacterized protein LOC132256775 n=1 Tax=Phlebotomus argentipes TaxID=94469 RepID=UPI002892E538|nr:uncharacterized protein LOC132256775 [Phlebotomus argentipes]
MLISILLMALYRLFRRKDPEPIFGVYQQRGKWFWLKYIIFIVIFYIRKLRYRKGSNRGGQGAKSIADPNLMEKVQPLTDHPKAFDAVFYIGANSDGYRFIMGTERRHKGIVHAVLYFVIPDIGFICLPQFPDTMMFTTSFGKEGNAFGGPGFISEPILPMNKWRLRYRGQMRQGEKLHDVEFSLEFLSQWPFFDFDSDLNPRALAEAMAREKWTQEYFAYLKSAHQSHYEQMGSIRGTLKINGESRTVEMRGFRDHSYGFKRDWSLMHRYAFIVFFLEDGRSVSMGVICQPCTCSVLNTGYICSNKGKLSAISWCDFELYQHGEGGIPPKDFAFQFSAGGRTHTVQILVDHENVHYVGSQWEAKMFERFISVTMDGVPGYGVAEFHYNNKSGRPEEFLTKDPQWYKNVLAREAEYKKLEYTSQR